MTDQILELPQPETALVLAEQLNPQPLNQNPAAIYLASLSKSGRATMLRALEVIANFASANQHTAFTFNWAALRYPHTAAIRTFLRDNYKPAGANKMLSALRRVLKEAWRLGQLTAEDYQRAIDLPSVKGQTLPKGRAIKSGELKKLLKVCAAESSPNGARDAAIFSVLYSAGLRRAELAALQLADLDREEGSLTVHGGKGGKDRITYLNDSALKSLTSWIGLRGDELGPLFLPINRGGNIQRRQLTNQAVLHIVKERAKQAGLDPATISPHDFRRTFISDLLDAGADISTVQKLAGHANVTTTTRYDRRGERAKQKAARLLTMPDQTEEENEN